MKRPRMMIVFVMFFVLGLSGQALAQLEVSPSSIDFGDVEVGTVANQMVRAVNVGYGWIGLDAEISGSADFAIASDVSVLICPGGFVDIEVSFTPSAEGSSTASLLVNYVVKTILSGEGVTTQPPPSVSIQNIMAFIEASVADGTLVGNGPGNSVMVEEMLSET